MAVGGRDVDPGADTHTSEPRAPGSPEQPSPPADAELPAGTRLGKFTVVRLVGAGGMGVVYEARDEVLGRRVALKLVRRDASGSARMLHEARAVAGLTHPNVVTVYEVGTGQHGHFIAMEYVDGHGLKDWLAAKPRGWREIVAMFVQAGEGLAAAHEAGLVHRDVKPDNILVSGTHAKVADFGLAREVGEAAGAVASDEGTRTGVAGTPRYMAPEQWTGHVDKRSDQYGLCGSLLEALGGEPPLRGQPSSLRAAAGAPAWVNAVVARGLAPDPAHRYPNLRELVAALRRDPARRRRQLALGAGAIVFAGVAATSAAWLAGGSSCGGAAERLAGVWDARVAASVENGFAALNLPHALRVWPIVRDRLDAYRGAWVATHTRICRAAEERETSPRALDLGMACLDHGRAQLQELQRRLAAPDRERVNAAIEAVDALAEPAGCADATRLGLEVPPPPEATRARVAAIEEELARIAALQGVHDFEGAVERAEKAVADARALDYRPLLAHALTRLGTTYNSAEQHAKAIAPLDEALTIAYAVKHDARVGEILTQLVRAAAQLGRDDVERWFTLGTAAVERLGGDPKLEATLRCNDVLRFTRSNRHADFLAHAQACADLSQRAFGEGSAAHARALAAVGAAQGKNGAHREAKDSLLRALALLEARYGGDSPALVDTLNNLASVERLVGELDAALAHARRALEIKSTLLGPDDPRLAPIHQNVGVLLATRGDVAGALPHLETAHRLTEAKVGATGPGMGESLGNLAIISSMAGKVDRAQEFAQRSLAVFEAQHPEPHETVVNAHTLLGTMERKRGDLDASLASLQRAVALLDAVYTPGHAQRVNPLMELGHTLTARADHAGAIEVFERVEKLLVNPDVPPQWTGEARFGLAKALRDGGRDPGRARDQATRARDVFAKLGPPFAPQVAEIDAWLAGGSRR